MSRLGIGIDFEDVLSAVVGNHMPQGDVSADSMMALAGIAMWAADEVSCRGSLQSVLRSEPDGSGARAVAEGHEAIMLDMLDRFPSDMVLGYVRDRFGVGLYETAHLSPYGTTLPESIGYVGTCSSCGDKLTAWYSFCPSCGRRIS